MNQYMPVVRLFSLSSKKAVPEFLYLGSTVKQRYRSDLYSYVFLIFPFHENSEGAVDSEH